MMSKFLLFLLKLLAWLVVAAFALAIFGGILPALFRTLFTLLFGWIRFLGRVLPEITFNLSAIAFAVICSGLLLWGTQRFCAWLYESIRSRQAADSQWPAGWPWRWTTCVYCGLWLLFLTSMSATGIAHQIAWLARSSEPIIESRRGKEWIQIASVASQVRAECERNGWNTKDVRRVCEESLARYTARDESVHERWHIVGVETQPGKTEVVFITYREPHLQRRLGYRRVMAREVSEGQIERLAEDIHSFTTKLSGQ